MSKIAVLYSALKKSVSLIMNQNKINKNSALVDSSHEIQLKCRLHAWD